MRSTEVIGKIKRRLFLTLASYFYFSSSFLIPHFFLLARGLAGGWQGVGWGLAGGSEGCSPRNPQATPNKVSL